MVNLTHVSFSNHGHSDLQEDIYIDTRTDHNLDRYINVTKASKTLISLYLMLNLLQTMIYVFFIVFKGNKGKLANLRYI